MYEKYCKLRDDKGVTDYRVSVDTGISATTLSEWGSGKYTPKVDKIQTLAAYFEVSLDYFYR